MKIHEVEQGTEEWLAMRKGKLTGTTSKNVVGYREMLKADLINVASELGVIFDEKKTTVDKLKGLILEVNPNFSFKVLEEKVNTDFEYKMMAADLIGDEEDEAEDENANPLQRGHDLEPVARKLFERAKGKQVDEVGFVSLEEEPRICLSPDGFIKNNGIYTEGTEIKCPCAWKYLKYWLEDTFPDEYRSQSLDYFVVNDNLEKLYLVLYNPKIEIHPLHIYTIERKDVEKEIAVIKAAQLKFWKDHDDRVAKVKELAANLTNK